MAATRHPDDIDLFSGAISERPEGNGLVGPTFACILSEQFRNLKFGDRFWFETRDPVTGFSLGKKQETPLLHRTFYRRDTNSNKTEHNKQQNKYFLATVVMMFLNSISYKTLVLSPLNNNIVVSSCISKVYMIINTTLYAPCPNLI